MAINTPPVTSLFAKRNFDTLGNPASVLDATDPNRTPDRNVLMRRQRRRMGALARLMKQRGINTMPSPSGMGYGGFGGVM